ncbi:CPCC family cysteine-rich protein [Streptomyces sp. NPDC007369]|uniref:CPCC family cysteine-rich protein n=1 Tax=Streptomyces sp. NPDC007369 TaxID=3154589 RepID=UPI0033FB1DFC
MITGALPCIVCGNLTIEVRGYYEICPVCGWEDDGGDYRDPDRYVGGPNHVTLREARENYRAFGASERRRVGRVRPPLPEEVPPPETLEQDVPGQVPSWLDFVDNPETLSEVYGAQPVPELDGVVVREVTWRAGSGPELLIRFDLPVYPADPPRPWLESGFDTVRVQLRLLSAATALEAAHDCDPVGRITLEAGAVTPLAVSVEAERFRARVNADAARIHQVTAYGRN